MLNFSIPFDVTTMQKLPSAAFTFASGFDGSGLQFI